MDKSIGRKIKFWAEVYRTLGIISSIFIGLFVVGYVRDSGGLILGFFYGILVGVLGSLAFWISSLPMYGFGVLVENSEIRTKLAVEKAKRKKESIKCECDEDDETDVIHE